MLLRELSPPPDPASAPRPFAGSERLREQALPEALQALLAVMAPEELRVALEAPGYVPQQRELEAALYRVCQEAVSNAIRHARARHLRVTATTTAEHAVLRISDDGCGLGTEFRPGLGLSSMRARVESAGGLFRVTPSTPQGTLIEARLPRADRKD
jgi:two-component system NarL family sensor kinase